MVSLSGKHEPRSKLLSFPESWMVYEITSCIGKCHESVTPGTTELRYPYHMCSSVWGGG